MPLEVCRDTCVNSKGRGEVEKENLIGLARSFALHKQRDILFLLFENLLLFIVLSQLTVFFTYYYLHIKHKIVLLLSFIKSISTKMGVGEGSIHSSFQLLREIEV